MLVGCSSPSYLGLEVDQPRKSVTHSQCDAKPTVTLNFYFEIMALCKRLICPEIANEPTTDMLFFIFNVVILYSVGFVYNE